MDLTPEERLTKVETVLEGIVREMRDGFERVFGLLTKDLGELETRLRIAENIISVHKAYFVILGAISTLLLAAVVSLLARR